MSNSQTLSASFESALSISAAAKSLSHPTRVEILMHIALNGASSPVEISRAVGETGPSLGTVSYHVRELVKLGSLKLDGTIPRRGALEHRYSIAPAHLIELADLSSHAKQIVKSANRKR